MEVGPTFRSSKTRYPVEDPGYRILRRQRSRYTHFYFYIHDPVLGAMSLCIGSFLPFQINCYLNGHSFIERELIRRDIGYRKDDNAFRSRASRATRRLQEWAASHVREVLHLSSPGGAQQRSA